MAIERHRAAPAVSQPGSGDALHAVGAIRAQRVTSILAKFSAASDDRGRRWRRVQARPIPHGAITTTTQPTTSTRYDTSTNYDTANIET